VEFDRQPHLVGQLLELRPLGADDWDALFGVASDPLIWAGHPARDRYTEPVFREFFRDAMESGGALVAIDRATGEIIGSSRYNWADLPASALRASARSRRSPGEGGKAGPFHDDDDSGYELEIGWSFLARACWGGMYNREMKRLMLDYAFQFVDRVIFIVGIDNIRSRKAMLKIGAVLTDRRVARALPGVSSESVIFEISKNGWSG
jgi:RimJ/RimL family protein N-acetyltransferase